MTIDKIFRRQYETTDAFQGVQAIRHILSRQPALVVLDEEEVFGIITAGDIAASTYHIVADCVRSKPTVYHNQTISEVLKVMKESLCEVLPVNEGTVFAGIICREDILNYYQHVSSTHQQQLHGLAHDLRNPISNVYTINNLLEDHIHQEENKELLTYSRKSVEYALELINAFLESEQYLDGMIKYEEVNVHEILERCCAQAKAILSDKNIRLTTLPNAPNAVIPGNAVKLQRIFGNLLTNAVKFSFPGNQIEITTKNDHNKLIVSISDEGIGIPKDLKISIFERFTPARRQGTSGETTTGLGLYICKILIEQHQGNIRISDNSPKGTIFHVSLPLK
jgi:signal transduction histidine kinase